MANPIVQAVYDLKDAISAKIKIINDGLRANQKESERTADASERSGKRQSQAYKDQADAIGILRENLGKVVAAAAAAATALETVKLARGAFTEAAAVEDSLARVKAKAEGAAEEFEKLGDQVEKSARAANVSSETSAAAALALAEQGEKANEIFETLTPTLLLAKDAGIEVADAAGIVDDALDLFGKNAGDAALVVDQLVAASKGSKEGLSGLATAIRTLAPDAQALGISFEQLTGLLGLLGQNGIDAGKAARGLRSIFQDLQNPTSEFSKALGDLGDHSTDFGQAITTLRDAGDKGKDALLKVDGAARSLILFLIQQAPGALDDFIEHLRNAQGTASETAKAIDETVGGSWRSFTNALDRLGSALAKTSFGPLQEEFTKLAKRIDDFAQSDDFAKLSGAFKTMFENAGKAFDEFLDTADFSKFSTSATQAINDIGESFKQLKQTASDVGSSISVFGEFLANLHTLDQEGGKALNGLINSIGNLGKASLNLAAGDIPGMVAAVDSAKKSFGDAGAAYDQFSLALNGSAALFRNVQSGAETTAPAIDTVAKAASSAADNIESLGKVGPGVFENTAAAALKARDAAQEHAQAIIKARQAVADAKKALDDLVTSGNASRDAMQEAAKKYADAQKALDALTQTADDAADSQRALKQAFAELGITTQSDLIDKASKAKDALDTIDEAFKQGKATIEDVQRAYDAYATKLRATTADSTDAAKESTEATLATKAALLGVADAATKAGTAGKAASENLTDGLNQAGEAAEKTAASVKKVGDAIGHESGDEFSARTQAWADSLARTADAAASADSAIVLLTADQLRGLREIGEQLNAGGLTLEQYEDRIQEVMTGTSEAIQKQIEQLARLKATEQDLLDQIAQENGDDEASEDARHKKALQDIKDEATLDGALNVQEYNKLKKLEDELHALKLKNIKEQQKARDTSTEGGGGTSTGGGNSAGTGNTTQRGTAVTGVTVDFSGATILGGTKEQLSDQLARLILPQLKAIAARSR
jgi:TP901 family phage tail tape measure protein